jgi:hypothetical protein
MQEKKEKVFADGFSFKRNETAPDYVVGRLSLKVEDAVAFIKKHANSNGWVNLSIMYGRSGNPYVELDTYEPTKQDDAKPASKSGLKTKPAPAVEEEDDQDSLPF